MLTLPIPIAFWEVWSTGRITITLEPFTYLRLRGAGSEVKGNICPEKCKWERERGKSEREAKLAKAKMIYVKENHPKVDARKA